MGMCKVEKLKIQACAPHKQRVQRVEKEDSSQEKRASVVPQLTSGVFLRHPVLAQRADGEISMPVGANLLKCPACLKLIEVGLLCNFIATEVSGSVSLLHLVTPPDLSAAVLSLSHLT